MLCIVRVMVHPTNHIWRISNLCCALSVSWFTLRTIFSKLVIYTVILLNLYGISIDTRFYPFYRTWFTLRNLSLVWGSLRLAQNMIMLVARWPIEAS